MSNNKFRTIMDNLMSMKKGGVEKPALAGAELSRVFPLREQVIEQYHLIQQNSDHVPEIKLYESDNAIQVLTESRIAEAGVLTEAQRQFTKTHSKKISRRGFDLSVRGVFQSVSDENYGNIVFDQQHSLAALLDNADDLDFAVPFAKTIVKKGSTKTAKEICAFGYDAVNNKSKKSNPEENFFIGYHANNRDCIRIYNELDDLKLDLMPNSYKVFPTEPNRYSKEGFAVFSLIFGTKPSSMAPWAKYLKKSCSLLQECYTNSKYAVIDLKRAKIVNAYDLKGVAYIFYRADQLAVSDNIIFDREHLEFSIKTYWNRHDKMIQIDGETMTHLSKPRISGLWEESVAYNYVLRAYNRFAAERGVGKLDLKTFFPNVWQAYNPN